MFVLVSKDGTEHWSDRYEVLCGNDYTWSAKGGNAQTNVVGGKAGDGEPLYVCKAMRDDDGHFTPGKLYLPFDCCYVSWQSKEHCVKDYLVMINAKPLAMSGYAHKTTTTVFFSKN